jgi:hypothetical protein
MSRTAISERRHAALLVQPADRLQQPRADWLNPSAQLYRMNFALDLAAGMVAGRRSTSAPDPQRRRRSRQPDARRPSDQPRRVRPARSRPPRSRARRRVSTSGGPPVSARVAGLLLASPEMQVR